LILREVRDHPYATQEILYRLLRGRDFDRSNLRAYLKHLVRNGFAEDRPEKHQGRVTKKHRYVITERGKAELAKTAPMIDQARTAFARTTYPSRASITD
jgi:DNA-binding PadR family transcriptional regulator